MNLYLLTKHVHMATVGISAILFILRAIMTLLGHDWRRHLWLKISPHINDTLLLISAITLSVYLRQYPFQEAWLTAKVLALIAYIVIGARALKAGMGHAQRVPWLLLAMLVFVYIVGVARVHHPMSWLLPVFA